MVAEEEHFSRWLYNPRFINDAGEVNERFITLRSHLNEKGISGQLFDRLTLSEVIETGKKFVRSKRDGTQTETLSHIAKAKILNIKSIALQNDNINVLEVHSDIVPQHAEIRFCLNNDSTMSARQYYYFEKIKDEMLKGLIPIQY
ncbi:MAG: hypothetical protein KBT34_11045 [Prevotella sp.]|nr:hypothetical protein [Candidatus Prevotella equi]